MSTLKIQQLELLVSLGWETVERNQLQPAYLDMAIQFPSLPKACLNDNLLDTICYQQLIEKLRLHLKNHSFRLLENLGFTIFQFVKQQLPSDAKVFITVTKFPLISGLTKGVSFSYGDTFD